MIWNHIFAGVIRFIYLVVDFIWNQTVCFLIWFAKLIQVFFEIFGTVQVWVLKDELKFWWLQVLSQLLDQLLLSRLVLDVNGVCKKSLHSSNLSIAGVWVGKSFVLIYSGQLKVDLRKIVQIDWFNHFLFMLAIWLETLSALVET